MTEILKPCPFCGGEAHISKMGYPHWIYCKNCGARVHGRVVGEREGEKASIEAWNRRTEQAGWIKTSEQMPIAYNPILLYHRLYKEICIGYWRALTGLWWVFNYGVYSDEDVITHWMPLPELPEEEENEI